MMIDLNKIISQLSSSEANERLVAIQNIEESLYLGETNLTLDIIQTLDRIANADPDTVVRNEANGLIKSDDYQHLCMSRGIIFPLVSTDTATRTPKEVRKNSSRVFMYAMFSLVGGAITLWGIYWLYKVITYNESYEFVFRFVYELMALLGLGIGLPLLVFCIIKIRILMKASRKN